jgi:F0F1-type ATP synthase delta subunit
MSSAQPTIVVPPSLVGRADISRLIRELEALDAVIIAQRIRGLQSDASRVTQVMSDLAEANSFNLIEDDDRTTIKSQLKMLKAKGAVVHMVFAEEPTPDVMVKMVAWIRENLHPSALVQTGLQPGIIAGCIVRTPSHIYDFSIASVLKAKKPILRKLIADNASTPTPDSSTVTSVNSTVIPAHAGIQSDKEKA